MEKSSSVVVLNVSSAPRSRKSGRKPISFSGNIAIEVTMRQSDVSKRVRLSSIPSQLHGSVLHIAISTSKSELQKITSALLSSGLTQSSTPTSPSSEVFARRSHTCEVCHRTKDYTESGWRSHVNRHQKRRKWLTTANE